MPLLAAALLFNETVLRLLFGGNAAAGVFNRLLLAVMDVLLVVVALALLRFRHNVRVQFNVLAMVVSTAIPFCLAEAGVRALGGRLHLDDQPSTAYVRANPRGTGSYRLKPGVHDVLRLGNQDITVDTNSLGMRWREAQYDNPTRKTRVAFVGDSNTFGLWATSVERSFVGVVDASLDKSRYEVLNFGVSGYGTTDVVLQTQEDVVPFHPQYLALAFTNGNDVRDNFLGNEKFVLPGLAWDPRALDRIPPPFRTPGKSGVEQAFGVSALYRLANRDLHLLVARIRERRNAGAPEVGTPLTPFIPTSEFLSYPFWSRVPYPDVAVAAADATTNALGQLHALAEREQMRLVIVTLPYREQIYASDLSGDGYDLRYPQRIVEDFARQHGVPYLDLLDPLRDYVQRTRAQICAPEDVAGHFNNEGHKQVGLLVAQFLGGLVPVI